MTVGLISIAGLCKCLDWQNDKPAAINRWTHCCSWTTGSIYFSPMHWPFQSLFSNFSWLLVCHTFKLALVDATKTIVTHASSGTHFPLLMGSPRCCCWSPDGTRSWFFLCHFNKHHKQQGFASRVPGTVPAPTCCPGVIINSTPSHCPYAPYKQAILPVFTSTSSVSTSSVILHILHQRLASVNTTDVE